MEFKFGGSAENQKTVLEHPSGLFVLFFTEMWERFSYYGMRALLVLFLIASIDDQGWGWERSEALVLYGWYTGLVYLTPIVGGLLADKLLGYRKAVALGAIIMTLGHASMALEFSSKIFFFIGLGCLVLGNGLFKPNISSIVGNLYKTNGSEKDAGYTIFYMGVNAGAFLGIVLCGYIGEQIGWHYGFGLAGIFMFLGMIQFWYAQSIFGDIGEAPKKQAKKAVEAKEKKSVVVKDRLVVIGILAFFTIFFWWAFEQAGGSMNIFAQDYTDRSLSGGAATAFKTINALITLIPMAIITWVLILLFQQTFGKYSLSNIALALSFVVIWIIVIWMLKNEFAVDTAEVKASWFGALNSLFILLFAPLFSKIWESKYNPSGPVKFALGLIILGLGFAALAYGATQIPVGAKSAEVSMIWLILAYLFHTLGELCLSPVGLSYVSKLAPPEYLSMMFGLWFGAIFISNLLGGITGSYIDEISNSVGLSGFFLIFTAIPVGAGIVMILMNKFLIKKMHGIN